MSAVNAKKTNVSSRQTCFNEDRLIGILFSKCFSNPGFFLTFGAWA